MKNHKVLLLGGPGTGKTTLLNKLKEEGYNCLPEISREVIIEAQQKGIEQLFLTEPLLFSEMLLKKRIEQYELAKQLESLVFIDRGIPDVTAYMDFKKQQYPEEFGIANKEHRYDQAFLLPVWPEIFKNDNERYENLEQAKIIEQHLKATYKALGYQLIEVPKDTVENRFHFILKNIKL